MAKPPNAEYYRVELDYRLVMDETARLMLTYSGGILHIFVQGAAEDHWRRCRPRGEALYLAQLDR